MYTYFIGFLIDVLWIMFYIIGIFYLGVAVFSLFPSTDKKISDGYLKIAVIVPAHNEACVIKNLLLSLMNQEYPKEYYNIFVIADNCTDETENISLSMGARVFTRTDCKETGKGSAVADAILQIERKEKNFDVFVVIDADNVADKRFLAEINIAMLQGNSAVQGYIDSKNPMDTWVSYAHSVWYWITNHIIQKGFSDLGIGCRLGGTGFAVSHKLLEEVKWDVNSLAEDAEYTAKLSLHGVKIRFLPRAVVYDEKPIEFRESVKQRIRWAKGASSVRRSYMKELFKSGKITAILRMCSDWLMPLSFTVLAALNFLVLMSLTGIIHVDFTLLWCSPFNMVLLTLYTLGMIFSALTALVQDRKYNKKIILNSFGFLIYILSWIPIGIYGELKHRKKEWYHTKHSHNK